IVSRAKSQVIPQSRATDLTRQEARPQQSSHFRTEDEVRACLGVVQGLDSHVIAREEELTLSGIPDRECEHASKFVEASTCPSSIRLQNYFGIGVASEVCSCQFQLGANFAEVINLSVVDDPITSFRIVHWLMAERRDIENGEPPVSEAHMDAVADVFLVQQDRAGIIRAAVRQGLSGALKQAGRNFRRLRCYTYDSTHDVFEMDKVKRNSTKQSYDTREHPF